jgi:hypothetical protein
MELEDVAGVSRENEGTDIDGTEGSAFGVVSPAGSIKVGTLLKTGRGGGGISNASSFPARVLVCASPLTAILGGSAGDIELSSGLLFVVTTSSFFVRELEGVCLAPRAGNCPCRHCRNQRGIHGGGRTKT